MPSRSEAKILRALGRRKGREEHGLLLVEGPRLLRELLDSPAEGSRVYYTEDFAGDELLSRCRAAGMESELVGRGELEEFADTVTPQGILAVARVPRAGWEDLPADGLLVFDGVQDPGNLGTLVRTAEAMGMKGAVCLPGTVDPWSPKVTRAAAGSTFRVPVVQAEWEEAASRLAERETEVWAADVLGEPVWRGEGRPSRLAVVLGNEGRGVSEEVLGRSSRRVRVPIAGRVDSLNVAVAGALLIDRIFGAAGPGGAS